MIIFPRTKISFLSSAKFKFHAKFISSCTILFDDNYGINVSNLHHLLQSSSNEKSFETGKICHGLALRSNLSNCILTCNLLINFYAKCGYINDARYLFDNMFERSLVSYNTMISGYIQNGEEQKSLNLFVSMHRENVKANEFSISSALHACALKLAISETMQLHSLSITIGVCSNVYVSTAILDAYSRCGMIDLACILFDEMNDKSLVTWSSMINGYVQNDFHEEALVLFRRAKRLEVMLTRYTLSVVLSACACIAAATEGTQLHSILVQTGFGSNLYAVSALIDMYSKCGHIKEAYFVFSEAEFKSIVLWNAMLSGFSRHTRVLESMVTFEKMQQMGICPNEVTYASVLSACSHAGLVEKGRIYFDLMTLDVNVRPNVIHYSCMVDILGRAGLLNEAYDLVKTIPFEATASIWGSLLSSCRTHGDHELAKIAAEKLFDIEPYNSGNYVLLSNVYAVNKKWKEVANARKHLKDSGVKKEKGKSWIEVKRKVHVFTVGDKNHPNIGEVHAKLEELGYKSETRYDIHDVEEQHKEEFLKHHSERLALAFGLISLPGGVPIRINKNLRVCGDCHSFMKFASRITSREIIVRDTNRFHHFTNDLCSCGDFW